ncbi:hypothetical protein ABFS83_04G137900 [Erythranthe nasuta]
MARISNGVITLLNLLTLILSIGAIGFALLFYVKIGSPCEASLRMPLLVVGGALMGVSMAGLLGACCRVSFFMWIYLITLFLLIFGLVIFTVFAIVVTNKGIGNVLSPETGMAINNHKLGDYSWWMQNYVINGEKWDRIKSCLVDMRLCAATNTVDQVVGKEFEDFYKPKISPIQSGCCKPPSYCGMQMQNSTRWNMPEKGPAVTEPDCKIWSNEQTELCFNCESCKMAALDNVRREWNILAIANTCLLISLTIIYSIGCCALRNNQAYGYTKYRNYYA